MTFPVLIFGTIFVNHLFVGATPLLNGYAGKKNKNNSKNILKWLSNLYLIVYSSNLLLPKK